MVRSQTSTGGRNATTAVIPGRYALSVGLPKLSAPEGWQWTPLSSIARLESGHTPSRKHREYWGGTIPWIGIRDATANHGRVICDTAEHTNDLGITNSSARVLPPHTVCLSRTASVGYVVMMGRAMATSQDFVNWVCSESLNPHFLMYVLLSEKEALHMFAIGSVHQTIYFPEAKAFHVCIPSRKEQDAIVEVLGALDEKIDLNRRMNETLESMARAVFKDWFVDFGPTRTKMEGGTPYLAPEIWNLFPDQLNRDGRPVGWSYVNLSTVVSELRRGISPVYIEDGGICVLNQKCIRSRKVDFAPSRRHDLSKRAVDGRQLMVGDILVNSTGVGTLGRVAQLWELDQPLIVDSHVTVVRPNAEVVSANYLGICLTGREDEIEALGEGSTGQTELSRARLGSLSLVCPPNDVQAAFDSSVAPLIKRMTSNRREQRILAETRDLLLPKLISGEIRINEDEAIAVMAA